ncbi:hypothetical protein BDA96_10G018800 [Sorghum bicolor]|uniref:Uncharacterized protein n=1 Tax=Sorghum bicolor TaxID=4558 RepID=A0A921Q128_SORBI|nr:hypothetical protein BDA96_10G018800 [Sorghum bicolor]
MHERRSRPRARLGSSSGSHYGVGTGQQASSARTGSQRCLLPLPAGTASSLIWWRRIRALASGQRRKGLDTLFALVSWHVWKERNARCFRDASATINDLLQLITMEADRWINAGATGLAVLARS